MNTNELKNLSNLAAQLEHQLTDRHGPMVPSSVLARLLGYASPEAFRQAVTRKTIPVPIFKIKNRRGYFALTKDIANWLAIQRNGASDQSVTSEDAMT